MFLQVNELWESYLLQGYSRRVRDPSCLIPASSRVTRGKLAPPGARQLMLKWHQEVKILLHKWCKSLFLIEHQIYCFSLKIFAVE